MLQSSRLLFHNLSGISSRCSQFVLPLVMALAVGTAQARPSITNVTGTMDDGSQITISGSSFGSKSKASPLVWDDFESGSNGAKVGTNSAAVGRWDVGAGSELVEYSSAQPHAGRMSSFHDFRKNYNINLSKNLDFTKLYLDYWMYVDYEDAKSRNFKPWRLYGDNDNMQLNYVWLCNGQLMPIGHQPSLNISEWSGSTYSDRKWYHVQLTFKHSDPNVSNGTIRHLINNQVHGYNSSNVVTRINSRPFNQIRIGHYWATTAQEGCQSNSGARIYTDNVYIDTSWARVIIADASTLSNAKHTEMLIPTSWNSSQIQATFNSGSFASGSTVYVFVVDENDAASAQGYPVKIGQSSGGGTGGDSVRPNPPSDLQAEDN